MAVATGSPGLKQDTPAFLSPFYVEQAPRWAMCRDVMLGTEAVRAKADEYLVRGAAETDGEFSLRASRAECFPMFKETVQGMAGLVFRKDPTLEDDVPETIAALWENIDGAGTHGAVFTRQVFEDALQTGHAGILVDMPTSPVDDRALTIAEEDTLGMRPYWLHVRAEQIINWRTQVLRGVTVLTLLVIRERHLQAVGEFGVALVTRYRVYRRDPASDTVTFSIYEIGEEPGAAAEEITAGVMRNVRAIPFAVVYAGPRRGPLVSLPPLIDLAYTNIAHVNVLADHRTSLHMAGVPIFVRIGWEPPMGDPDRPGLDSIDPAQIDASTPEGLAQLEALNGSGVGVQVIGANTGIDLPSGGDAKYVEHNGQALGASANELTAIEKRAAAQGLSLLSPDTRAAETAEAKRLDRTQQDATLSRAARGMQDCIEQALEFTAQFLSLPSGGSCIVNQDFQDLVMDTQLFAELSKSTLAGQISLPTFWRLLVAGNILPDDFDPDTELEILQEQNAGITLPAPVVPPAPPTDPAADPAGDPAGDPATPPAHAVPPAPPTPASGVPPATAQSALGTVYTQPLPSEIPDLDAGNARTAPIDTGAVGDLSGDPAFSASTASGTSAGLSTGVN